MCLLMALSIFVSCGGNGTEPITTPKTTTGGDTPEEGIVLDNTEGLIIAVGETKKLSAINIATNTQTLTVLWSSSDPAVAVVDTQGNVTGVADGEALITASTIDGKYNASCPVKVSSSVSGVTLDKNTLELEVGSSYALNATVLPEGIPNNGVTWYSSVETVATVTNSGVVTAVANGTTSIGVKTVDGEYTAFCTVTVVTSVRSIELSSTVLELNKGVSGKLTYTITPITASDKSVAWSSSDEGVAMVSGQGMVTAVGAGTAVITVQASNGTKASCVVTVKSPVTGVTINPSSLRLSVNNGSQLSAIINPADADIQDVRWSTNNPSVATVGELTGVVTAHSPGVAIITVTTVDGLYSDTCEVTVYRPLSSMSFEQNRYEMDINTTIDLVLNTFPADAEKGTITFQSSNDDVATVDPDGKVRGISHGEVTITASSEYGITATCTVNVIDPEQLKVKVDSIEIENDELLMMHEGEKVELKVKILPEDATDKSYSIKLSNDLFVKIIDNNIILAVAPGTVRITVTSTDGGYTAEITVNVTALSQEEIQNAIDDYNSEINAENKRHDDEVARLEKELADKTANHNTTISGIDKSIEEYTLEQNQLDAQIQEYRDKYNQAIDESDQTVADEYSGLISTAMARVNELTALIEDQKITRKTIADQLAQIQAANSAERVKEDNAHTKNMEQIRAKYEYILKYVEES